MGGILTSEFRLPNSCVVYIPEAMDSFGIWSVLPPVAALGLALWKKQIYPALLLGVWMGWWVVKGWNPITATAATVGSIVAVFQDAGNARILIYSLLVGSVLTLISATGGVEGFVSRVAERRLVTNRRQAQMVPFLIGMLITVESSITALVAGTVGRPLTDRYLVSREKLAYNGWGALVIGLLAVQGVANPVATLLASIRWNFYPMLAILLVLATILTGREIGPMRTAERRARDEGKLLADGAQPMVAEEVLGTEPLPGVRSRALYLVIPVVTMVGAIIAGILITGRLGSSPDAGLWEIIEASSGSTAVLWAVLASLAVLAVIALGPCRLAGRAFVDLTFKGMGGMIPVVTLLVLAFALGSVVRELGTGAYVAGIIGGAASAKLAVAGSFALASFMAFATGTSWGTFALMVPIAVPLAVAQGGPLPLYLAAVLGGGVFGDHCSPISDTTIISSMASASDHMDHVRTQIPYALVGAVMSFLLYLIVS
jgi:tetracycline resistance efflux pump